MVKSRALAKLRPNIRWMVRKDMEDVLRIEADSFQLPWTEKELMRCLKARNCIGMVAEHDGAVLGHVVYSLEKTGLEILTLAVDVECRRQGVARTILEKLRGKMSATRRNKMLAVVRETNLDAQLFLAANGFRACVPLIRNYYDDTAEDAIRFVYRVKASPLALTGEKLLAIKQKEQPDDLAW